MEDKVESKKNTNYFFLLLLQLTEKEKDNNVKFVCQGDTAGTCINNPSTFLADGQLQANRIFKRHSGTKFRSRHEVDLKNAAKNINTNNHVVIDARIIVKFRKNTDGNMKRLMHSKILQMSKSFGYKNTVQKSDLI